MCGRAYATYTEDELAAEYDIRLPVNFPTLEPNYNLCPSHMVPVIGFRDGERAVERFRWGLIPHWAKDEKIGYKMINARSETVETKPAFKVPFQKRRCLIPVSGFVEWKREEKLKRPFKFFLGDRPIMTLAGLWDQWRNLEGEVVRSFTVLTTSPNELLSSVHDRMPVILKPEDYSAWLSPETSVDQLRQLMKPCDADQMDGIEISTAINSPKNTGPEVLQPL